MDTKTTKNINMVKISNINFKQDSYCEINKSKRSEISSIGNKDKKKCKKKIKAIITISSACLIVILAAVLLIVYKSWKKDYINNNTKTNINVNDYEKELVFKTKVNDIRRLSMKKISNENLIFNGIEIQTKYLRKTNYDIYFISEKRADEENKDFYDKIYTASISMVSQCLSTKNEECELKNLVNLLNNDKKNLSSLKEINDLKDIPIPLCLFNITDTNIIISISCPESLPESIKKEILSDLYYFRPVAKISSKKTHEMDIITENNIKNIRKQSKGLCDMKSNSPSTCNIDSNITKDSEGNFLAFNETASIDITTDINNKLSNNKTTHLIDITSQISYLNPDKFKAVLNDLLLILKPYMKYEEIDSINKVIRESNGKIIIDRFYSNRHLEENDGMIYKQHLTKEESLFSGEFYGKSINLNLKIDSGINVETMKALSVLKLGDENIEISKIEQPTNLNKIIDKLKSLSNKGNYLAYQLYEKLKKNIDELPQELSIQILNLNNLIIYKDLTEIFNSSLPLNAKIISNDIIEGSNILFEKLNKTLNHLEDNNSEFKKNSLVLKNYINNYFGKSYDLMNKIFYGLDNLTVLLNSPKNKFTEIATIYSNNTPTSYVSIIQLINDIHKDNNQKKLNLINGTIEKLSENFEYNYLDSIKAQKSALNAYFIKLQSESLKIENEEKEDYLKVLNNVYNSNEYTDIISSKIKNELRQILYNNDYIASNEDKNKYNYSLEKSSEIAKNLDNDEIIDKTFDKIMINFKNNFTEILKYMDKIKEEKFSLIDDVLKDLFSSEAKYNIKNKISELKANIINTIKKENDYYINLINKTINEFINNDLESLNSIMIDLNTLLSNMPYLYQRAFYDTLDAINNDISYNKLYIELFFHSYNLTFDYAYNNIDYIDQVIVLSYVKTINNKYFEHYNIFKNKEETLKNYINRELYDDFLEVYNNIKFKLKEIFLSIKNNKITDLYPQINKFDFYNNHLSIIDELNGKIEQYFSLDIFNMNYLPVLNKFISQKSKEIEDVIIFMNSQHNTLKNLGTIDENDTEHNILNICFDLKCSGKFKGVKFCSREIDYDHDIKAITYSTFEQGKIKDTETIEYIFSLLNEKSNYYNSKMNMIKDSISNFTKETIEKNMTENYLLPFQNEIYSLLNQKYGEELIKSSYIYYKNNIETKLENILNNINNKLNESFNSLEEEINNNLQKFKYSINEFGFISRLYEIIISQNISNNYYDSIITFQKKEFNYTISFYYNYLLTLINSTYSNIINNIPYNEMILNNIIDLRKREINDERNKIISKIKESKNKALNIDNQINVLQVEKSNFFGVNSIFINCNNKINDILNDKINKINKINNNKLDDEYSITSKLYSEYSLFSEQINKFYKDFSDKLYIELNKIKFKELINNNWIFDQDDIIIRLIASLYNSNQDIYKDVLIIKENYTLELEKEINKYFTKETMMEKINELYNNGINEFTKSKMDTYKNYLHSILNSIYGHFKNESKRINNTVVSYNSNFTKINNTIKNYKQRIINETKTYYTNVLKEFRDKMMNNVYKEYIEKGLNGYVIECKKFTKNFKEYNLLNSSYNLKEIINNIIEEIAYEYKQVVLKQIDYKYQITLKLMFDFEGLEKLIDEEVDIKFNELLLPFLKKKAINSPGHTEYDFNENIKKNINTTFNNNTNYIYHLFLSLKGYNYEVNINNWKHLDFSNVNSKLANIENNFEKFILLEKNKENDEINECLKHIIQSNFNLLFNNIISSFGNDFLERSISFNEYYRINDLYDNLKYSLFQTSSFYLNEFDNHKTNTFPKELKKIYKLNNIELLIQNMSNNLLNLLSSKITEFINDTKDNIIDYYLSFMKGDSFITNSFSQSIKEIINEKFELALNDIENGYTHTLNIYLKDSFIVPYKEIVNKETNEIIDYVKETKNKLMNHIDNYLTLESENVLEEINIKINNILELINDYNSFLKDFKIPDELVHFFNDFGTNNIKPIYDEFKKKLDKIVNNDQKIIYENNVENYEKSININKFLKVANETFLSIKDNYINNMTNNLNNYIENYPNNIIQEISKDNNNMKYNSLDETFEKIMKKLNNTKLFIESLKEFNDYDKTIINNINNLNQAYKVSKKLIEESDYDEETINTLNELKEKTMDYYNNIIESYYNFRQYLDESFTSIYNNINKCINTTYETLIKEYKKISEEEESINKEYYKKEENLPDYENNFEIEDKIYNITAKITDMESYANFILDILFEDNNYKYPKLVASIINKSRPKKMSVDIYSLYGNCSKTGTKIEATFNDAIYTMNLNYGIKAENINVTTITNYKKYKYNIEVYEIEEEVIPECFIVMNTETCINNYKCESKKIISKENCFSDKKE